MRRVIVLGVLALLGGLASQAVTSKAPASTTPTATPTRVVAAQMVDEFRTTRAALAVTQKELEGAKNRLAETEGVLAAAPKHEDIAALKQRLADLEVTANAPPAATAPTAPDYGPVVPIAPAAPPMARAMPTTPIAMYGPVRPLAPAQHYYYPPAAPQPPKQSEPRRGLFGRQRQGTSYGGCASGFCN
jgi:hypothetical protein